MLRAADLPPIEEPAAQLPTPGHLSVTQMAMVLTCPEQFRQRYVLGKKERPGGARVLGSAVHKAIERNYRHKIVSGEDLPPADVLDAFHESWEAKLEEAGGEQEVSWDAREAPDTMRHHGHALTAAYRSMVAPKTNPIAVEEQFAVTENVPLPVIGVIDVETFGGLIDLKVTSQARKPKPTWLFQGRVYQLFKPKPFEWHLLTRTKVPGVYTAQERDDLHMQYEIAQREVTLRRIDYAARLIADQYARYGPDRPWDFLGMHHDWACSFCGWRPTCEGWK